MKNKKEYKAPVITVIKSHAQSTLLVSSGVSNDDWGIGYGGQDEDLEVE